MKNHLEDMLKEMNNQVKPRRWFGFKMKARLYKRAFGLFWAGVFHLTPHAMIAGKPKRFHFVGALTLIGLTLTSGVGAYAYASPDVTVMNPLYPVKQSLESAESYFARSSEDQANFHRKIVLRRMAETETLVHEMKNSQNLVRAQEGMKITLKDMEDDMQLSLSSAAQEDKPESAEKVIDDLHDDFEQVDEHLNALQNREHIQEMQDVKEHLDTTRTFTKARLQRMEEVSLDVKMAVKTKAKRVFLRRLMRDDMNENENEQPIILNRTPAPAVINVPATTDSTNVTDAVTTSVTSSGDTNTETSPSVETSASATTSTTLPTTPESD